MEIKQKEHKEIFNFKEKAKGVFKKIFNKRFLIVSKVFFMIIIFLFGTFAGLFVTGFFGTLDNPSQVTVDALHAMGFTNLFGIKSKIETTVKSIAAENVKIPFNYISGKFSDPEKIFINIDFEDYEKLKFKREQALERGILVSTDEDYVPAIITYGNKEVRVRIRLKGDMPMHFSGDKWSFRINVRGDDTLFGMQTFSIQDPKAREYLDEWVYHYALKQEGILSMRYNFVDVTINGDHKGIYNLEENFDKYLIEANNRREGPIIKFDESVYWDELLQEKAYFPDAQYITSNFYPATKIDSFKTTSMLEDPVKLEQFNKAKNLLESFRDGKLKAHEVFDVDLTAKYFAIGTVLGAPHASYWRNIRFYYNPITSLLEPIGYDAAISTNVDEAGILAESFPKSIEISTFPYANSTYSPHLEDVYDGFFSDPIFYEKYVQELEIISKTSYLDDLFEGMDEEINKYTKIIHSEKPTYHFFKENFYNRQKYIQRILSPATAVNAYYAGENSQKNTLKINIGNIYSLPIEIIDVRYENSIFEFEQEKIILQPKKPDELVNYDTFEVKIPNSIQWKDEFKQNLKINYKIFGANEIKTEEILPWSKSDEDFLNKDFIRQTPSVERSDFLEIDNSSKSISFKKGSWILNQSLIIPEGYIFFINEGTKIDLIDEAMILSYSKVQLLGSEKNPIKIFSSDGTGEGFVILNAKENSYIKYTYFNGLTNPSKEGWILTGAITFYNSPFKFENVKIIGMNSEDSVDGINSKYEIKNSLFKDCFSDCFDDDFGGGIIKDSLFANSGNDCLDISGAEISIQNVSIINPGDKGISAGEKTNLTSSNLKITGGNICVASKDLSNVIMRDSELSNCVYGFTVYQKKSEFGPASITSENTKMSSIQNNYLVEINSNLVLNEKIILGNKKNVYEILYPEEF